MEGSFYILRRCLNFYPERGLTQLIDSMELVVVLEYNRDRKEKNDSVGCG